MVPRTMAPPSDSNNDQKDKENTTGGYLRIKFNYFRALHLPAHLDDGSVPNAAEKASREEAASRAEAGSRLNKKHLRK